MTADCCHDSQEVYMLGLQKDFKKFVWFFIINELFDLFLSSVVDPDPHPHQLKIRIWIRIKYKSQDPDPHQSDKLNPERVRIRICIKNIKIRIRIWIRFKQKSGVISRIRFHNTAFKFLKQA